MKMCYRHAISCALRRGKPAEKFFATSPLQRVIGRAVYNTEYQQSLMECVGGTKGDLCYCNMMQLLIRYTRDLKPLVDEFRRRKENKTESIS